MKPTSPWLAVLAVVGVVALGLGLDRLVPLTGPAAPGAAVAGPATSGTWYCAAGGTSGGSELLLVTAAPPSEASEPSEVVSLTFSEGERDPSRRGNVFASSAAVDTIAEGYADVGVATRWWDQPVAVTRQWEVVSEAGVSGLVAGPCVAEPSDRWIVPGLATAGGAEAVLHLANPFGSDAAVAVTLTTPDGVLAPRRLENVVVPRRSVRRIELNEHAPEQTDLGVVVDTRAGRVVAEAVQSFNAAIGGVEGLSLAAAAPQAAETWTIPWFADDDQRESWLWLTNAGDRAAAVELTVHTDDGGAVPEGLEELILEPGVVERIDLRGLLPDGADHGAVTVRSDNGQPITASVATQFLAEEADRTGIAVELGSPATDDTWVLSGGPTEGRDVEVHLVNPGGADAVVDLSVWAGSGVLRPAELRDIPVAAGAAVVVPVSEHLVGAASHAIFVTARSGAVVAGHVAISDEGRLDPVVSIGSALGYLSGGGAVPPVRFAPGMPQRIGTPFGPEADDPLAPADEAPTEPSAG